MTREEIGKRLPMVQAWCEGKTVQYFLSWKCGPERWVDYGETPDDRGIVGDLCNEAVQMRVKPQPRDWWICAFCASGKSTEIKAMQCCGNPHPIHTREVLK